MGHQGERVNSCSKGMMTSWNLAPMIAPWLRAPAEISAEFGAELTGTGIGGADLELASRCDLAHNLQPRRDFSSEVGLAFGAQTRGNS